MTRASNGNLFVGLIKRRKEMLSHAVVAEDLISLLLQLAQTYWLGTLPPGAGADAALFVDLGYLLYICGVGYGLH